jgi:hypothetical protein
MCVEAFHILEQNKRPAFLVKKINKKKKISYLRSRPWRPIGL